MDTGRSIERENGVAKMKITSLTCPHCGASLHVEGEGKVECKYCRNTFFAEEEKAPITMNTVVHNYHSEEEQGSGQSGKALANRLLLVLGSTLVLMVLLPLLFMQKNRQSAQVLLHEEAQTEGDDFSEEADPAFVSSYSAEGLEEIGFLREMSSLKELELTGCEKIEDYSVLANMPGLERLRLQGAAQLKDMGFVRSMSALKALEIEGSMIKELAPLEGKLSLTALKLKNNGEIQDFSVISTLRSLKSLHISPCSPEIQPDISELKFLEDIRFEE